MMWTRFLVVSFVLVADMGGVWESAADTGETERLIPDAQFLTPPAIAGSSDSILLCETLLSGDEDLCGKAQPLDQTFVSYIIVRNPSLADPYYSRGPPVLA